MPEAFLELDLTVEVRGVLTQLHPSPDSGQHLRELLLEPGTVQHLLLKSGASSSEFP